MRRSAPLLLALALLTALPAVAAPPASTRYTADYVSQNLIKGETTQQEVIERFGKPGNVEKRADSTAGLREIWTYTSYSESGRAKVANVRSFFGKVASLVPNTAVGEAASEAWSKTSQAEGKMNQIGDATQGEDYWKNKSIRVEFTDGVVSHYSFN